MILGAIERAKDIVNIYNVDKYFKLYCSDSLIAEGNGRYIGDFINRAEIITEVEHSIYGRVNIHSGTLLKDQTVVSLDDEKAECYKIILLDKYLYTDMQRNEIHVEKDMIFKEEIAKPSLFKRIKLWIRRKRK